MRSICTSLLFLTSLVPLTLLAQGCGPHEEEPRSQPRPNEEEGLEPRSMVAFSDCEDLVGYAKAQLQEDIERLSKKGFEGEPGFDTMGIGTSGGTGGITPDSASPGAQGQDESGGSADGPSSPDHSETNNQTQGIDEPDVVKTDGKRMFSITRDRLRIMSLDGSTANLTDTLPLLSGHSVYNAELLIHGNRILVFLATSKEGQWKVQAIDIDANVPGQAKIVGRLEIDGEYVSARKVDSVVRLVLRTPAQRPKFRSNLSFITEARKQLGEHESGGENSEAAEALARKLAREFNEELLAGLNEQDLRPTYQLEHSGKPVVRGFLYGCEQSMRPGIASGIDMLSVLSLDLNGPLAPGLGTGVMAKGSTVYANASSLYVATHPQWDANQWMPGLGFRTTPRSSTPRPNESAGRTTYLHKFDIRDPKQAVYRASGSVDGELLNQFAMSEHQDVLRVAATRYRPHAWEPTDSFVATLQEQGKYLVELGRASGLGKTEKIRSVRFMGDVGYVVTFRQTDPLYTLDLKNPAAPTVLGELKIDGYSAYLHPLSPGYLLGVGRDADPQTGAPTGLQVSIFDVRDLQDPTRIHNFTLKNAMSRTDTEHRAFLYWPKTKSLVLPVQRWNPEAADQFEHFRGAMMFGVDPESGITVRSEFRHPQQSRPNDPTAYWNSIISRSVVVGDTLWTSSNAGMMASSVENGEQRSWMAYP